MRCPKCHYLSFEPEPRCKNCGYGFSAADEELPLSTPEPAGLADLRLRDPEPAEAAPAPALVTAAASTAVDTRSQLPAEPKRPAPIGSLAPPSVAAGRAAAQRPPRRESTSRPASTAELPLFVRGLPSEVPEPAPKPVAPARVVASPAPVVESKPPVLAKRASPVRPLGPLDRDLLQDLERIEREQKLTAPAPSPIEPSIEPESGASPAMRFAAAAFDALLLAALSAATLWVILRWCDLPLARAMALPAVPVTAFLLLMGAGYLAMFNAAGGQTLGKMLFGIRVVSDDEDDADALPPTARQAAYRAFLTLPSVLLLGIGFLPALMGSGRALHDRLSHTRVVRA